MSGISFAPEMYQRVMQKVLKGCEGVNNNHSHNHHHHVRADSEREQPAATNGYKEFSRSF